MTPMTPTDIRNANWELLQKSVNPMIWQAYRAWLAHGPGTTRGVAAAAGWDILTFRPRTTDCYQLGLVALVRKERRQGVYRALPREEWERFDTSDLGVVQQVLMNLPAA